MHIFTKLLPLILMLLFIAACKKRPSNKNDLQGSTPGSHLSQGFPEALRTAFQRSSSIEDFLATDELRSFLPNAILMTESRSIQIGTPEFPRIILVNEHATTMLAYIGLKEDPSYQKMEAIQFDPDSDSYRFFELTFAGPPKGIVEVTKVADVGDGQNCQGCHNGAPIWDPYDFWPGAMPKASVCRTDAEKKYFEDFEFFVE